MGDDTTSCTFRGSLAVSFSVCLSSNTMQHAHEGQGRTLPLPPHSRDAQLLAHDVPAGGTTTRAEYTRGLHAHTEGIETACQLRSKPLAPQGPGQHVALGPAASVVHGRPAFPLFFFRKAAPRSKTCRNILRARRPRTSVQAPGLHQAKAQHAQQHHSCKLPC